MGNFKLRLNIIAKVILLVFSATLLVGCGKSSPGEVPQDIIPPNPNPNPDPTPKGKAYAWCNQSNSASYQLNTKTFVTTSKEVRFDWVLAKILRIPSEFKTNSYQIAFFRWQMDSDGKSSIDNTALGFQLQSAASKAVILNYANKLTWSDVSTAAGSQSVADFFANSRFLINTLDPEGNYQAIKMVVYDKDGKAVEEINQLLPIFAADPLEYASTSDGKARSEILTGLHPFKDLINQGITAEQFQGMADGLCYH